MLPLFEMMMQAQNGAAVEALARQLNLAQEQATKAIAALMPAFAAAFRKSAADPANFTALLQAIGSGSYAPYFEDIGKAFTADGLADGGKLIERLFGSREVADAIAAQAAQMTGIGQDIYQKMMPVLADMLMGGLFKTSTTTAAANPFLNTATGGMMQDWLKGMGFAPKPAPMPQPSVFDNPFTQAMGLMFGAQPARPEPAASGNPLMDNPFTKSFQEMMKNSPFAAAMSAPEKASGGEATVPDAAQFNAALTAMFDSGLEVQKAYLQNIEAILDGFKPSADKS
jgi:hypothetical protein